MQPNTSVPEAQGITSPGAGVSSGQQGGCREDADACCARVFRRHGTSHPTCAQDGLLKNGANVISKDKCFKSSCCTGPTSCASPSDCLPPRWGGFLPAFPLQGHQSLQAPCTRAGAAAWLKAPEPRAGRAQVALTRSGIRI